MTQMTGYWAIYSTAVPGAYSATDWTFSSGNMSTIFILDKYGTFSACRDDSKFVGVMRQEKAPTQNEMAAFARSL